MGTFPFGRGLLLWIWGGYPFLESTKVSEGEKVKWNVLISPPCKIQELVHLKCPKQKTLIFELKPQGLGICIDLIKSSSIHRFGYYMLKREDELSLGYEGQGKYWQITSYKEIISILITEEWKNVKVTTIGKKKRKQNNFIPKVEFSWSASIFFSME